MMVASEPIAPEAVALTEKKVDMALDDIIKLSKNPPRRGKWQRRAPNKNQKFDGTIDKGLKLRRYMDSKSAVRQGSFAKKRSNFQGNQFALTTEVANKAAVSPIRSRDFRGSRVATMNKSRSGTMQFQRRPTTGGYAAKSKQQFQPKGKPVPKQKPQTLDSLFANMREERMKTFSSQRSSDQQNGGGSGLRRLVPWARGRFGN